MMCPLSKLGGPEPPWACVLEGPDTKFYSGGLSLAQSSRCHLRLIGTANVKIAAEVPGGQTLLSVLDKVSVPTGGLLGALAVSLTLDYSRIIRTLSWRYFFFLFNNANLVKSNL